MSYSPQKADFLAFLIGEHDNGQQFEQLIFIEIALFFIEVFRWKKISKEKPHASFNRRLSVVKKPEGNMTTAKKN